MKSKLTTIVAAMLLSVAAIAQTDSVIHVKAFPGVTVGEKVTAAMLTCQAAPVPCILTIDASLASAPSGTMPSLCGNCYLYDWRTGPSSGANGNAITPKSVNAVQKADQFTGADAGAKITACLAAIPSGGVCDARGFGATTQTISSTVTIGTGQAVIFNPSTTFIPASASVQPIALKDGAQLLGDFVWNVTGLLTWNSSAVTNSGTIKSLLTHIDRLHCIGVDGSGNTDTLGACILLDGASGSAFVQFLTADGVEAQGFHSGVKMVTSDGGWVNGNTLANVNCVDTLLCFDLEPNGVGADGTQVSNNNFPNWSAEYLMPGPGTPQAGQIPIYIVPATGSGQSSKAVNNVFADGNAFDFPAGSGSANYIAQFGVDSYRNVIRGALCVSSLLQVNDTGVGNVYYDTDPGCGSNSPGYVNSFYPLYDANGVRQGYLSATQGNVLPGNLNITGHYQIGGADVLTSDGNSAYLQSQSTTGSVYVQTKNGTSSFNFQMDQNGHVTAPVDINAVTGFKFNGTAGFTGTKTAGSCALTIQGGIITNVTGC